MVALVGLVALVLAVLTGSTPLAMLVIALAVIGIVMLVRNWREERRDVLGRESGPSPGAELDADPRRTGPNPDEFSPDISGDPDGPSSDARAD